MLHELSVFDGWLLVQLQEFMVHPAITPIVRFYSELGDAGIVWIVISILLLFNKKTRKMGFAALIGLIVMHLSVNIIIKPIVQRPRPYDVISAVQVLGHLQKDYSFPSGHTAAAFAASFAYFKMSKGKQRIFADIALVMAFLMGLSRIYIGVHYPGDVLGGALIGMLSGWIGCLLLKAFIKYRDTKLA